MRYLGILGGLSAMTLGGAMMVGGAYCAAFLIIPGTITIGAGLSVAGLGVAYAGYSRFFGNLGAETAIPQIAPIPTIENQAVAATTQSMRDDSIPAKLLLLQNQTRMDFAKDKVLKHYIDTTTREVMVDPVMTAAGQTYERSSIATWLFTYGNNTDINTAQVLANKTLVPNHCAKAAVHDRLSYLIEKFACKPVKTEMAATSETTSKSKMVK